MGIHSQSITLVDNGNVVEISATQKWPGGHTGIVMHSTTKPTTVTLQLVPDGIPGKAFTVATISTGALQNVFLPQGEYRVNMSGGTALAVTIKLCTIPA